MNVERLSPLVPFPLSTRMQPPHFSRADWNGYWGLLTVLVHCCARAELEAAEGALEAQERKLAEAASTQKEAETRARSASDLAAEKDAMIKYVEEEVDRVKGVHYVVRCRMMACDMYTL